MAAEERITFCRICEALCGLVATVEDGRVVRLRPDPEHPLSRGYACPKGIAMTEIQNDPDRLLHPLRRRDGGFERVSWDEALADIGARLRRIRAEHGPAAIAWYTGNPSAFSYAHLLWAKGFLDALGSPHYYSPGSQDVNSRFAASALLYGSPLAVPFPDLSRTHLLVILGANPLVSHGSVLTAPRIRDALRAIVERGGRVVVVDPRRTETARAFEHVPVVPDTDAWLLLSLLHALFELGRGPSVSVRGLDRLREAAAAYPPEATAARTGVPAETVRELAAALAATDGAALYGRTGSCLGRFGTLVSFLIDAVNVVSGNLDRPGGAVFGDFLGLDRVAELAGVATYGERRSRFGGFPDVLGNLPAALLPREIETPGRRQIRALFVSAGNPVLSVPDGAGLERAFGQLDLLVSLDLYVNETGRHADYVLPATTWLEREDVPVAMLGFHTTPFVQATEPVVAPAGVAREEWQVVEALARELRIVPSSFRPLRALGRVGIRLGPRRLLDLLLLPGLRRYGVSVEWLRGSPRGVVLAESVATGVLRKKLRHRDRRVHLDPPEILAEVERLAREPEPDPRFPLRLIGMRELRSHNSWMHNAPLLMRGRRTHALRVHPRDAAACGVADGAPARVISKSGRIEAPVLVTDELTPGTVALPHGWGHRGGGWGLANEAGGANVNLLASSDPDDLERLAGMAFLNGIPVRVEPA